MSTVAQVFFKPNQGYHDTFGVAWPMRKDAPKVRSMLIYLAGSRIRVGSGVRRRGRLPVTCAGVLHAL